MVPSGTEARDFFLLFALCAVLIDQSGSMLLLET